MGSLVVGGILVFSLYRGVKRMTNFIQRLLFLGTLVVSTALITYLFTLLSH